MRPAHLRGGGRGARIKTKPNQGQDLVSVGGVLAAHQGNCEAHICCTYGESMPTITQTPETTSQKTTRLRQEGWERQVASFWHEYAPTPETRARLDAAIDVIECRR